MSSDFVPAHLESCLLEKMAKFRDDFLEALLLPVYLMCKRTYRKKEKHKETEFPLQHCFDMEMCHQHASDYRKQKQKHNLTHIHTYTQFLKALFSPVKVFNIQKVCIYIKI